MATEDSIGLEVAVRASVLDASGPKYRWSPLERMIYCHIPMYRNQNHLNVTLGYFLCTRIDEQIVH
jgi:hypothetical protein